MKGKAVLIGVLGSLLILVSLVFWQQELKFLLPTPLPADYQPVENMQLINLEEVGIQAGTKPTLLHFYNPDCPCSRFSTQHFASLVKEYGEKVSFYLVLQRAADRVKAGEQMTAMGLDLPIILDEDSSLAQKSGVYSTPQAVLLDTESRLYYRGNYNRARYCTDKNTSYARQALAAITAGERAPSFSSLATKAYGCQLSEESTPFLNF